MASYREEKKIVLPFITGLLQCVSFSKVQNEENESKCQSQIKHQRDATLCRFYFYRLTLHVSDVKRPSSGVLKTGTAATGACVMVAGRSSHQPNMVM
jgi:hypothetical protein